MLIEFKVANYRSIRAEQTLSMVASNSEELPQNLISCDHVPGLKGTKLVKAVALYGANASGKKQHRRRPALLRRVRARFCDEAVARWADWCRILQARTSRADGTDSVRGECYH